MAYAGEKRDPYTAGHQTRVDRLACAIARELGLSDHQIEGLHFAALLHDIGKIGIPEEILNKPTCLTQEEFDAIKMHPALGAKILHNIPHLKEVSEAILQHHEHFDGSGYPKGLREAEIHPGALLLNIADTFDAEAVRAAIRGAQQGVVMYPEFKHLTCLAGCAGYTVWITGRHVSYFGRKGEMHVERFPD